MLDFKIIVFDPVFPHIFSDVAYSIHRSLLQLGHQSQVAFFRQDEKLNIHSNQYHIVFAPHLVIPDTFCTIFSPERTIFINTEPIRLMPHSPNYRKWGEHIMQIARHFKFWDYSLDNLAFFQENGIHHGKFLALGHDPMWQRVAHNTPKDIDVLFYGGLNPRRATALNAIQQMANKKVVAIGGFWGAELDAFLARAKLVVNIHVHEYASFESVRCAYLFNNRIAVLSEDNGTIPDIYRPALCAAPYGQLLDVCQNLLADENQLAALRERAWQTVAQYPQHIIVQQLLAQSFV